MWKSFSGSGSGSPLQARATAPILLIILALLAIAAVIFCIFLISSQITKYKKSEKYLEKEQNRLTNRKDVTELGKEQSLSSAETNMLWKVCQVTEFKNIRHNLKTIEDVESLFNSAFLKLKTAEYFTEKSLDVFFSVLYKMEMMVAQRKTISSTRQITVESKITYISASGEQYPLTLVKNDREYMSLEIPAHINNTKEKPQPLVRSRFTYKTPDGLSYNFIARVMRYDTEEKEGKKRFFMIVSHSEQLESQAQRHFKREFTGEQCTFTSLRFAKDNHTNKVQFIYGDKTYKGKLSNISAGGCCIQTNLPVKEKQNISVSVATYDLWNLPGIIRRTRRLPDGKFALHIQFNDIPLATKNKIQCIIYKYDL